MKIDFYQVDAFSDRVFSGNYAAVCVLAEPLDEALMQSIAAENNLPETAFVWPLASASEQPTYFIRWYTPTMEMDLCGHASLAAAYVLLRFYQREYSAVSFQYAGGHLSVEKQGEFYWLSLPERGNATCDDTERYQQLKRLLPCEPEAIVDGSYLLVQLPTLADVQQLQLQPIQVSPLHPRAVIFTAVGNDSCDFVSRFFAPNMGVDEDPVTGSAHCQLVPYWADQLGKTSLKAKQLSVRGGDLMCQLKGGRVYLGGRLALYLEGCLHV